MISGKVRMAAHFPSFFFTNGLKANYLGLELPSSKMNFLGQTACPKYISIFPLNI
jgi:hypothetical protein